MPVNCAVLGCKNHAKTRKQKSNIINSASSKHKLSFFRFPSIYDNQKRLCPLRAKRRSKWIEILKRKDFTDDNAKYSRICSEHFQTGKPSSLRDTTDPDWIPSLNLGYEVKSNTDGELITISELNVKEDYDDEIKIESTKVSENMIENNEIVIYLKKLSDEDNDEADLKLNYISD